MGVSIGAALAEARRQAGLTVAQVSQRTRIRQTIIRGIEGDDCSVYGGDFYARAAAAGPGGGDNPQLAYRAIDASHASAWRTDWYTTARFGNLSPGTGLLLGMGHPVTVTGAAISLGSARGAALQIRVGPARGLAQLQPVAGAAGAAGVLRLRFSRSAHGRYVLLWFTRLPADPGGAFQASVYNIKLTGG